MDRIKRTWTTVLICAVLSTVTLVSFWPVTRNGFLSFDDAQYVTENPRVLHGLSRADERWAFQVGYASNWHPVTWLSHMLDVQLFGVNAHWHHLVNLMLHVLNAILLFLLFRRTTGALWRSAFVAGLFALHPLHVESVAWVAERKDVLSTLFFMLTLLAYAMYAGITKLSGNRKGPLDHGPSKFSAPQPSAQRRGSPKSLGNENRARVFALTAWYFLALLCFTLGLMSKPMLVTVPFVLLLLDLWPLRRVELGGKGFDFKCYRPLLLEKLPFLALALGSSVITYLAQDKGNSVSSMEGLPFHARAANAVISYLRYVGKTLWPVDLAIFYPHPGIRGPAGELPVWQIGLAALALLAVSIWAIVRLKREAWFATGWFWFLGTLVPVIGLVQVGAQAMADRYSYVPLIGLFICMVWGTAELVGGGVLGKRLLAGTGVLALAACALITHKQTGYWKDDLTVFGHALEVTTNNSVAHYTVGLVYARQGKYDQAMAQFRAALAADPASPFVYYSMAVALGEQGKTEEAMEQYREAIRLKPRMGTAHNNLGALLWRLGRKEEAIAEYTEALRLEPGSHEAHFNMGNAWLAAGKLDEAVAEFRQAVRLKPDYGEALTGLAKALIRRGKPGEAEIPLREVVHLCPTNAGTHVNLGELLDLVGKRGDAVLEFREAVRLEPTYSEAYSKLATTLIEQGDIAGSATEFSNAVALKPDFTPALSGLGHALAMQGKLLEAEPRFRDVVRLSPTNAEARLDLGNTLVLLGRTNEARECFDAASGLDPELARKNLEAGKSLADRGQIELAIGRLTTAVNLKPDSAQAHEKLGVLLARQGKLDAAVSEFQEALQLRPEAQTYYDLGLARLMQAHPEEAIADYQAALRLNPDWPTALNDLAWVLATCPQPELRNGAEAVRLAERACELSRGTEARFWGTLDAAYAEAGRFTEAISTAEKARLKAIASAQDEVAKAAETRLALYRKGQAYHQ